MKLPSNAVAIDLMDHVVKPMPDNRYTARQRYQQIAPFYDLLDAGFEYGRYRSIRALLFQGLSGRILDAGVGILIRKTAPPVSV